MTIQEMINDIQKEQHHSGIPKATILAVEQRTDEEIQWLWTYLCKKPTKEYPSNIKTGYKDLPKRKLNKPIIEHLDRGYIKVTNSI